MVRGVVIISACIAMVTVQAGVVKKDIKKGYMTPVEKQKFFFEILRNVGGPLMFEEYLQYGEKLIFDKTRYTAYDQYMTDFYETYKVGDLIPKGEVFSVINRPHLAQALGLFNFLFYAKDWETFLRNVVWARINVNQGMFVYTLTLAVYHRPDLQGIFLPQIYEIFPQMFFTSKLVTEAQKFDWELFNKQIMNEKQFKTIYEKKLPRNIHGNWYTKDWKVWQWWKFMGLDDGWQLEKKCILREDVDLLMNDSKWTAIWTDLKKVWMPVDYTRDIDILNDETKLSYFTEDVDWNAFMYRVHMDYAKIVSSKQVGVDVSRRGEWWLFYIQQISARYYLERLSNGLGDVSAIPWHGIIKAGYDPHLIAYNGVGFSSRKNYWEVQSYESENVALLNAILALENRADDAIAWGKIKNDENVIIDLSKRESLEIIGNMMHGNIDSVSRQFFGFWITLASVYLSGHRYEDASVVPSTLSNYETMMRDPLYYQMIKRVIEIVKVHKANVPAYTRDELLMKGVTITDVKVDKFMTYFDLVDHDVTNLLTENMVFKDGKFVWDKILLARQMRLNHKPYNIDITVTSDKAQVVGVRIFIAPDIDEFGQKINPLVNREVVMEIEEFVAELVAGENVIKRSSEDFFWTSKDRTTYSELYKLIMMAYEGKYELPPDISRPHCQVPTRMFLPRGWPEGMPIKMFVMITPLAAEHTQPTMPDAYLCGIAAKKRTIDDHPYAYPFDRKIVSVTDFSVPNMFWTDTKIYHMDTFAKYQDTKYENFGTFDYNYI